MCYGLLRYIRSFYINPCGKDGTCLVKASCKIATWLRTKECPDYEKYSKRRDRVKNVVDLTISIFWLIIILTFVILIILAVVLGVIEEVQYLIKWLR